MDGYSKNAVRPRNRSVVKSAVFKSAEPQAFCGSCSLSALPLDDREVVLTFDDGPLPPYTSRVLDILASECVKATFFLVGRMAKAYPDMVRKIHASGHSIGTHSNNHPFNLNRMSPQQADAEVEGGISAVADALRDRNAVAPFFRIPGLMRGETIEHYLADRSLMTWSADFPADDWLHISANEVAKRALNRIEARGRGMLLLHDIKPATALALPVILSELKQRGYRVVHVETATPDRVKTATLPSQWLGIEGLELAVGSKLDHVDFCDCHLRSNTSRSVGEMPSRILLRIGAFSGHAVDGKNDLQSLERRCGGRIENGSVCGRSGDDHCRDALVLQNFLKARAKKLVGSRLDELLSGEKCTRRTASESGGGKHSSRRSAPPRVRSLTRRYCSFKQPRVCPMARCRK